jgi:phosphopentomutase
MFDRAILIILDGVGVGELPDAGEYDDEGSNTLGNLASAVGGLHLPYLESLGLGRIIPIQGVDPVPEPKAAWGKMAEVSPGKDSTTGHWELCGLVLDRPFPVYPHGFPPDLVAAFEEAIGSTVLGNVPASGTAIIEELGEEHIKTGKPIIYTSADSVFQIAAHEEVIPVERLYEICQIARELLHGVHAVGRVIARPFVGTPGGFVRTERRRDLSLPPPGDTLLDLMVAAGYPVVTVGKVDDIFAKRGITRTYHTVSNEKCMELMLTAMDEWKEGLLFTNLVEFDMTWGHRNDAPGFARGLEAADQWLPRLTDALSPSDIVLVTADHGNDPTTPSTDHSREYVPLLVWGPSVRSVDLGVRSSFADVGATLGEVFSVQVSHGTSFLKEIVI